jgi:type IV secretion system protein VirB7
MIFLLAALAGCASSKSVLPSLEGKPRIPVNKQIPAAPVTVSSVNQAQEV